MSLFHILTLIYQRTKHEYNDLGIIHQNDFHDIEFTVIIKCYGLRNRTS